MKITVEHIRLYINRHPDFVFCKMLDNRIERGFWIKVGVLEFGIYKTWCLRYEKIESYILKRRKRLVNEFN